VLLGNFAVLWYTTHCYTKTRIELLENQNFTALFKLGCEVVEVEKRDPVRRTTRRSLKMEEEE
jgi:hypothetical protein